MIYEKKKKKKKGGIQISNCSFSDAVRFSQFITWWRSNFICPSPSQTSQLVIFNSFEHYPTESCNRGVLPTFIVSSFVSPFGQCLTEGCDQAAYFVASYIYLSNIFVPNDHSNRASREKLHVILT